MGAGAGAAARCLRAEELRALRRQPEACPFVRQRQKRRASLSRKLACFLYGAGCLAVPAGSRTVSGSAALMRSTMPGGSTIICGPSRRRTSAASQPPAVKGMADRLGCRGAGV